MVACMVIEYRSVYILSELMKYEICGVMFGMPQLSHQVTQVLF